MAFCFAIIPAKAAAEGLSISVTERKEVFGRRSGKHGIRSQAGPLLHGSDRKAGLSHPCPNDSSFLKKTFSHTKADLRVPFLRPEGQTDPPAIRLSTHGGIRTRGKRGVEPHRTGPWRKPQSIRLPCARRPRHTLWQSLAHRCDSIHTRCWCLASVFYHIVEWDSRKKSCELHELSVNSLAITRFFTESLCFPCESFSAQRKGDGRPPPKLRYITPRSPRTARSREPPS